MAEPERGTLIVLDLIEGVTVEPRGEKVRVTLDPGSSIPRWLQVAFLIPWTAIAAIFTLAMTVGGWREIHVCGASLGLIPGAFVVVGLTRMRRLLGAIGERPWVEIDEVGLWIAGRRHPKADLLRFELRQERELGGWVVIARLPHHERAVSGPATRETAEWLLKALRQWRLSGD